MTVAEDTTHLGVGWHYCNGAYCHFDSLTILARSAQYASTATATFYAIEQVQPLVGNTPFEQRKSLGKQPVVAQCTSVVVTVTRSKLFAASNGVAVDIEVAFGVVAATEMHYFSVKRSLLTEWQNRLVNEALETTLFRVAEYAFSIKPKLWRRVNNVFYKVSVGAVLGRSLFPIRNKILNTYVKIVVTIQPHYVVAGCLENSKIACGRKVVAPPETISFCAKHTAYGDGVVG